MKKIIAILLAVLVAFSTFSVAVMAEEAEVETTAAAVEEGTDEDNLVKPENMNQLKLSVIFKAFEKVISFFIDLIEQIIPGLDLDGTLADGVGGLGDDISDRIDQVYPQA